MCLAYIISFLFMWLTDEPLLIKIICFIIIYVIGLDPDMSPDELEEKARLITQVLELQNTLDGKFIRHKIINISN